MTELKPCPFCGAPAEIRGKGGGRWYVVRCTKESCECSTKGHANKEEVIRIWNRRHNEQG